MTADYADYADEFQQSLPLSAPSALLSPKMHAGREDFAAIAPSHLTTDFTDDTDTNKELRWFGFHP
jgi:hypothetical protein